VRIKAGDRAPMKSRISLTAADIAPIKAAEQLPAAPGK
jgi:hypothetical protein